MDPLCNPESAWGLIKNQTVIKIGGIMLLLLILYFCYNAKNRIVQFGWVLIFIGGAGNLYERFANGCVKDYIKPVEWWPMFNVADAVIILGVLLIIFKQLKHLS